MIDDSVPWKDELVKVADRLETKTRQAYWDDRTAYLIERDFMVSAYAIRKLTDAFKVSDALRERQIPVERFTATGRPISYLLLGFEKSYDLDHGQHRTLSVRHLCNQIIHSFVFLVSGNETIPFDGVYVASDHDCEKHVTLIRATDFIALCRDIGVEDVYSKQMRRDADGNWRAVEILGRPYAEFLREAGIEAGEYGQSVVFSTFRCAAEALTHPALTGWAFWLRLEGDSDNPNTWHPVAEVHSHFGDIDTLTVDFHDDTTEKVLNPSDQVEIAVVRPKVLEPSVE